MESANARIIGEVKAMVLEIGKASIKRLGDKSRLCSNINWGDRNRTLWFEVEREYEEYLCIERIDSFLVALLPFAMMENLNIHSEGYVSERLLYQLKTIYLPTLRSNIPEYHSIDIGAKGDGKILESQNAVGTGLSCGVDSFYTVLKNTNTELEGYRLTHLTFFNIINHPQWQIYGEDASRDFYNARIEHLKPVAEKLGLRLVTIDSNLDLFYHAFNILATYSFRYLGAVLALQKLFGKYYWSSGCSISEFELSIDDIALFDPLTVQCLSNENTTFYSTGSEVTRLEKTAYISDLDVTYKYLNVCWVNLYNCTDKCEKCKRTVLGLYALGKLDRYGEVFNIDSFYKNINGYLGYMLFRRIREKRRNHTFYHDIYQCLIERDIRIPKTAALYAARLLCSSIRDKIKTL